MGPERMPRMLLTSWCPSSRVRGRPRMSFGHTIKKFIINLNDKLDDPEAKAWDPSLTGKAATKEQWRWTELASQRWQWRKIIQRTAGWREREKAEAEAYAAQYEANWAARGEAMAGGAAPRAHAAGGGRAPRAPAARNGRYATVAPPTYDGNNTRDARAARRATREQANQQQGGHWN